MINGTKLVIDTGAQRGDHLAAAYGCLVVPLAIVVDGDQTAEDELAASTFYGRVADGASVSTAAPAPGEVLQRYQAAADEGASAVLSIHMSANLSGTFNAARVASEMSPIPVELMDTSMSGFGVDMCIETAATALADGADVAAAVAAAQGVRERLVNVFVVGQPAMFEKGGRSHVVDHAITPTSVLATGVSGVSELAKVDDVDGIVATMAAHLEQYAAGRRVWLGVGHAESPAIAAQVRDALRGVADVAELAEFDLGLSLVAHLGPGTVAATFCTVD